MRNGTDVDRDSLAAVLKDLDFEVVIYNDLKKSELFGVLDKCEISGGDGLPRGEFKVAANQEIGVDKIGNWHLDYWKNNLSNATGEAMP